MNEKGRFEGFYEEFNFSYIKYEMFLWGMLRKIGGCIYEFGFKK